jgi:hypothetical protein
MPETTANEALGSEWVLTAGRAERGREGHLQVEPVKEMYDGMDGGEDHGTAEVSRRSFLNSMSGAAAAALIGGWGAASAPGASVPVAAGEPAGTSCSLGPFSARLRAAKALKMRLIAAQRNMRGSTPPHPCNGDETLYANKIANFSKGLPHNALGEVDLNAYAALVAALTTGNPADFESIPLGSPEADRPWWQKLVNPQAGYAFDLEGMDPQYPPIPPAPTFDSAEEAGEIVENYWMTLTRDVPFAEFGSNPLTLAAADDLSAMSDFRGPKQGAEVTPDTLFRGFTAGDAVGPYISQFLWRPAPFGAQYVEQQMRTTSAGVDFLTDYADWLNAQNGIIPSLARTFEPGRRYIINGRDLGEWVHVDVLFQAYFNACLILLTPPDVDLLTGGIGAPLNPGNPYNTSATQIGFGTLGGPYIATILCEVATRALKAVWCTKWMVHRRLRPEMFAGRIHNHVTGAAAYPIHTDVLDSPVLDELYNRFGSYLLPMGFPEGCPLHPAYGAGHATVAGACVTVLKAMFDENYVIPNPVVPDPNDPTQLIPYEGPELTVGGELNKLASNVALGRNIAGVHWRSDYTESLKLGEAVAISILADHRLTFNEDFDGFTFSRFNGDIVTV